MICALIPAINCAQQLCITLILIASLIFRIITARNFNSDTLACNAQPILSAVTRKISVDDTLDDLKMPYANLA